MGNTRRSRPLSAPIPMGWYRVCKVSDAKAHGQKKREVNLLGGTIHIAYMEQTDRPILTFEKGEGETPVLLEVIEHDPFLFAWFPAGATPAFALAPLSPLAKTGWSTPFHLRWTVRSNLLEIAENAADMGHFTSVHVYKEHARLSKFLTKNHKMSVLFCSARRILGIRVPIDIELHYQGLGWVESQVKTPLVELNVLYTPTPIDPGNLDIVLSLSFRKTWNPLFNLLLRWALPWETGRDYKRDIPIWENKIVLEYPKLCQGDGPIMKLRRWAAQFYPNLEGN